MKTLSKFLHRDAQQDVPHHRSDARQSVVPSPLYSRRSVATLLAITLAVTSIANGQDAPPTETTLRIGVIGLDTSHVPAFTKSFNSEPANPEMQNCRVVAAYPYGSRTIESSYSRIPKYTEQMQEMGIEIVDSIDDLLDRVDCVLLETNDGKPHLDQALAVFKAGKPVFIDKPVAANLAEVVAIYRAAEHFGVPMFSSSSLRYSEGAQAIRDGKVGRVLGCNAYSPASTEPSHTDLFWYGIHGVESLYTCMGTGCQSVSQTLTPGREVVVGVWSGGRIGTYHGIREGKTGYGGTAMGEKGIAAIGDYGGYKPLVVQIAKFFRTRELPIDPNETIELYAFMEAAAESRKRDGQRVTIAEVMQAAEKAADKLLAGRL
ncbi:Inositol 2-dehydrogenase/D-chiro-inositol 3-dehydrogenase [Stieleria maiorica]|uniref:Inositol 2-dehydrogenase/D-chiro-inositol 3-dehydrogenase n=1 Tax=Stieleria maiorica TaxID=2795974 RepID=A0A5B9MRA8_9BACT|nr:Gfo/Idh/MocA family oxidoreductase [Stieleria maiorica]QEG02415.1 Inositol 2-dehydrogenase/D-chiro-inositol 3-dehydrogenase [Stieleria maiorica]